MLSLKRLDISGTRISELPALQKMGNLEEFTAVSSKELRTSSLKLQGLQKLQIIDICSNNIQRVVLEDLPSLEFLLLRNNLITTLTIQNNTKLNYIDISYNRLSEIPGFLFGIGAEKQPIRTVLLSSNLISQIPRDEFNYFIETIDLSHNSISVGNQIAFFSPLINSPEDGKSCLDLIRSPLRRRVNLIGNNISNNMISIIEIVDFERRGIDCDIGIKGIDQISRRQSVYPQSCEGEQYLSMANLKCEQCFSEWLPYARIDYQDWIGTLNQFHIPINVLYDISAKTFSACSMCHSGSKNSTRKQLAPNCHGELTRHEACEYPCKEKSPGFIPFAERLPTLLNELRKPIIDSDGQTKSFIDFLFKLWKNVTVELPMTSKTQVVGNMTISSIEIKLSNCSHTQTFEDLSNALLGTMKPLVLAYCINNN